MDKVTVTTITTHFGDGYLRKVGDEYETLKENAANRKGKGLVEYDGPAATEEKGQIINVSDKSKSPTTTTAIVEQNEENQGKMIEVEKEKIEKPIVKEAKEKKEITKPVTKK